MQRPLLRAWASSATHLHITRHAPRQKDIAEYRVEYIAPHTANIRSIGFRAVDPHQKLTFLPGQWLDAFIPGEEIVGGFSVTSAVGATSDGLLELTVKRTNHPPAKWMADVARVGDVVSFRVGGHMHWPPRNKLAKLVGTATVDDVSLPDFIQQSVTTARIADALHQPLLLVAGGIGITPFMAIIRTVADMYDSQALSKYAPPVVLLYTAQTLDEIAFVPELRKIAAKHPNRFTLQLYITNESPDEAASQHSDVHFHRIERSDIQQAMELATRDEHRWPSFYVCGPPAMIDSIQQLALDVGLPPDDLQIERW